MTDNELRAHDIALTAVSYLLSNPKQLAKNTIDSSTSSVEIVELYLNYYQSSLNYLNEKL